MKGIRNTITSYGMLAKFFHWIMAILFFGMFIIAYIMINISKSDFRFSLYDLHKATGIVLFCVVALRLLWRLINTQPTLSESIPRLQKRIAQWNIILLYILMFTMPITGFLTSTLGGHAIKIYNLFIIEPLGHNVTLSAFFAEAHELLSYLLLIAFTLHVLGALYHHYLIKDDVLKRMWYRSSI